MHEQEPIKVGLVNDGQIFPFSSSSDISHYFYRFLKGILYLAFFNRTGQSMLYFNNTSRIHLQVPKECKSFNIENVQLSVATFMPIAQ